MLFRFSCTLFSHQERSAGSRAGFWSKPVCIWTRRVCKLLTCFGVSVCEVGRREHLPQRTVIQCVNVCHLLSGAKIVVVFICLSFIYPCCRFRTAECLVEEDLLRLVASCSQVGRWPLGTPPWLQHRARCPGGPLCGVEGRPAHSASSSVTACGCASQMSPQCALVPAFFPPKKKKRPQMPFISPPTLSEVGLP